MLAPRKYLSAAGLLSIARKSFSRVSDRQISPERSRTPTIPLVDCLMSGLAVFGLKSPSLLQFDKDVKRLRIPAKFAGDSCSRLSAIPAEGCQIFGASATPFSLSAI
jgi:hypothetical protein